MKRIFSCVLSVVLLLGAEFSGALAQELVAFATIAQGPQSGIHVSTELVIRTPSEWQALWQRHTAGIAQARTTPPAVDFSRDMVVAAFAGQAPMGSRFAILKILTQRGRLEVQVQFRGPPGPEPVDVNPVTPFHIIRLPRSPLPVVFVRTTTDLD